jgi:hypothetical protein
VMPDNETGGRLEDFVSFMVPEGDKLWEHAGSAVDAIPDELRRFKPAHRAKAHVHTWLAWQKEPGVRLGPGTHVARVAERARSSARAGCRATAVRRQYPAGIGVRRLAPASVCR